MTSYFCNEAALELPGVYSLVDVTRHCLEIRTEEGAELQFVIERPRNPQQLAVAAAVEASVAERRRSLRGFELLSLGEREYQDLSGVEVRATYIDRERGPLFLHELHCQLDRTQLVYQGTCRMPFAAACDQFMFTTLGTLRRR